MPYKDLEVRKQKQKQFSHNWYVAHRDETIAKVAHRKRTTYAGICVVCGGPTIGETKGAAPKYCGKPQCKSVRAKANANAKRFIAGEKATLDEVLREMETRPTKRR